MSGQNFPTAFDVELDSERGRWLRRRFLWFCVVNMLVAAPFLHDATKNVLVARGSLQIAAIVWHGTFLLSCFLFAGALIYAWRSPPSRERMVRLAVWLSCVTGVMSLMALRIAAAIDPRILHINIRPTHRGAPFLLTHETLVM